MRILVFVLVFSISFSVKAKEWKSLKTYQKTTQNTTLTASDWLTSDRKQNTQVWQNANLYNLSNNKPEAYNTIKQRRDFYTWYNVQIKAKGHEVIWPKMAYFISHKLRLVETFPHKLFISKNLKEYANLGSETVFNNAFQSLKNMLFSDAILKGEEALNWDKKILHDEQFVWIADIYQTMDAKSLKQIERMAKGKFLYGLFVPKAIRFKGDISSAQVRYEYALTILRDYCENLYN